MLSPRLIILGSSITLSHLLDLKQLERCETMHMLCVLPTAHSNTEALGQYRRFFPNTEQQSGKSVRYRSKAR